MPEGVRRDLQIKACFFTVVLHAALHLPHRQTTMPAICKKWRVGLDAESTLDEKADEFGYGGLSIKVERKLATTIVFANCAREVEPQTRLALEPDMANIEPGKFRNAKASMESENNHGAITSAKR